MIKIFKIIFKDILKNKTILFFLLILILMSWISFLMEDDVYKGLIMVMNEVLFVVPLMAILFTTVYVYNSKDLIILLLGQPIERKMIWRGIYMGVSVSLCASFLCGAGLPILIFAPDITGIIMLLMGLGITLVFVSLSFLISSFVVDKSKGIGVALVVWLFFSIIYDGLMLFIVFQFSDYPIDNMMIVLLMLNPVDLSRLQILMQLDVSAIMGYAGAVFRNLLGTTAGTIVSAIDIILWIILPYYVSVRIFQKKDL